MTLIADSGSTKTDWVLLHSPHPLVGYEVVATFRTQGITPVHQTPAEIQKILSQELSNELSTFHRGALLQSGGQDVSPFEQLQVFFYGSGCTPAHVPTMVRLINGALSPKSVEVHSDLMAAARGLCGHEAGIACILGTGANSCLYDGEHIVQNTPALGYILGDEGSGAVLGRMFLNAIFKSPELCAVRDEFLEAYNITLSELIERVYRGTMVNRYLASLSPFIHGHLSLPPIRQLVVDNFRQFFRRNIKPYNHPELPVNFVGSMAHHYGAELAEAAQAEGFTLGAVEQTPLKGLISYHAEKKRETE